MVLVSGLRRETAFLLRGSLLLIALLTLWWFALRSPFLMALRQAAGVFLTIDDAPSGDWTIRVPLDHFLAATAQSPPMAIHSIDFDLAPDDAASFTFSILILWAVLLAASGWKLRPRPLLLGSAVVLTAQILMFLIFAKVTAGKAAARLPGALDSGFAAWYLKASDYFLGQFAPYFVPVMVALTVDRELRRDILAFGTPAPAETPAVGPRIGRAREAKIARVRLKT